MIEQDFSHFKAGDMSNPQPKGMGLVIEKCAKALEIILRQ
jgi:hypothetical protein